MPFWGSRKGKERRSRFRRLLGLAMADGVLDPAEQELLQAVASSLKISPEEFYALLKEPQEGPETLPQKPESRMLELIELVEMMLADQEESPEELAYIVRVAGRMGVSDVQAPALVRRLVEGITAHEDRQALLEAGMKYMH